MPPETNGTTMLPLWFATLITSTIVIATLWVGSEFLIPLAVTALLFILSSALVDRFRRIEVVGKTVPGWLAHVLSALAIIGVVLAFGIILSTSAADVEEALPRYQERLALLEDQIEALVGPRILGAVKGAVAGIDLGSWVSAALSELAGALSGVVLVVLYLVFLAAEQAQWVEKLPRLVSSEADAKRTRKVLKRISDGVKQYMWVNAITSAMSGAVAYLIFSLVDLDFAPLLALIVFFAGFIPNIGAFIGIGLPALVALIQFDEWTPFLVVLFGYGLADQFIANVIQPSMQGRSLNVSTFMVMVSLTFWAAIWGGIGAFLAIPLMFVTMVICAEIPGARWIAVLLSSDGVLDDPDVEEDVASPQVEADNPSSDFEQEVQQLRSDFEHRND